MANSGLGRRRNPSAERADLSAALHRRALLSAVVVAAAGFGVLSVAYLGWGRDMYPELRGLFGFGSATIGDAVLLPLSIYWITVFHGRWPELAKAFANEPGAEPIRAINRGRRLPAASALLGIASTGLLYWTWLNSPTTQLNWTMPSAGELNVFGYWHLGFFGLMSVWFWSFFLRAGSLVLVAKRHARFGTKQLIALAAMWPPVTAVIASLVFFSALLAYDYRVYLTDVAGGGWTWWVGLATAVVSLTAVTVVFARAVLSLEFSGSESRPKAHASELRPVAVRVIAFVAVLLIALSIWFLGEVWHSIWQSPGALVMPAALAALAAWNFIRCLYPIQGRTITRLGRFIGAAVFVVLLIGYGGGLAGTLGQFQGDMRSWSQLLLALSLTIASAVIATAGALALALFCIAIEENLGVQDDLPSVVTVLDSPQSEVTQNFVQFALMQVFLLAPLALFRMEVLTFLVGRGLGPSEIMQLFYGYAALVGVAITFPLSQNMAYVRDLKVEAQQHAQDRPEGLAVAKRRGDYYTTVTICVGVITLIEIAAAWLTLLTRAA